MRLSKGGVKIGEGKQTKESMIERSLEERVSQDDSIDVVDTARVEGGYSSAISTSDGRVVRLILHDRKPLLFMDALW
jgi:hypothetical protein